MDEPRKIITDFWNTINSDKVNENIFVDSDVEVVNLDGVQIVCIRVPHADWRVKSIYLNGNQIQKRGIKNCTATVAGQRRCIFLGEKVYAS